MKAADKLNFMSKEIEVLILEDTGKIDDLFKVAK